MSEPLTEAELRTIAAQLSHPNGEAGIAMGRSMNESNTGMVLRTIEALGVADGDRVLELGHGNCTHLGDLLAHADNVRYHGLEISATMHTASVESNQTAIAEGHAEFGLYDGTVLPFADASFAKAFTVNTLYFWREPVRLLNELHRVLRPSGTLCVTYAQRSFMERLPFTRFGFQLYDDARFQALVARSPFRLLRSGTHREHVTTKDGQEREREYTIVALAK